MYAVIKTGGKQYRVKTGDVLVVEKLAGEPGSNVAFDQVLMLGDGAGVTVGAPLIEGAVVNATLVETRKGEKIKVFKKIRRQGYRRTGGHRQIETVLRVVGITGDGKSEAFEGAVDLTPRSVLNARARGLDIRVVEAEPVVTAEAKPAKASAKAKVEAEVEAPAVVEAVAAEAPAAEVTAEVAEAPAKKKAAPKAKAAEGEAEAAPAKKTAAKKAKTDGDDA